jgi:hypothetical protein
MGNSLGYLRKIPLQHYFAGGTSPASETALIVSQAAASVKSAAGAVRSVAQSLLKAVSPELGVVGRTDHLSGADEGAKSGKLSPQRNLQEIKVTVASYLQWKYFIMAWFYL